METAQEKLARAFVAERKHQQSEKEPHIDVTHVNIRQSITLLVFKIVALDIIAAIILSLIILSIQEATANIGSVILPVILIGSSVKIILTVYLLISWVYNYYEIDREYITHKKGFIFEREERSALTHIGSIRIEQGLLGRIFNWGTIKAYNWEKQQYATLYQIHNPRKYLKVIEDIIPDIDVERKMVREKVILDEKE